jgi:hypothetical protein
VQKKYTTENVVGKTFGNLIIIKELEPKKRTQQYNSETGVEDMEGPDGSSFEGYKDGKIKAPGTPAGAFNEVGGMKVAGYLRQNPNATDEELSTYLSKWANTGKITKKPKVSGVCTRWLSQMSTFLKIPNW